MVLPCHCEKSRLHMTALHCCVLAAIRFLLAALRIEPRASLRLAL
ncbi:rCG41518, partial [Rattus norvegicus]